MSTHAPRICAALFVIALASAGCGGAAPHDDSFATDGSLTSDGASPSGSDQGSAADSTAETGPQATSDDTDTNSETDTDGSDGVGGDAADSTSEDGSGSGIVEMEVDLGRYAAAGRVASIPAPASSASGSTWNFDTDRVWVIQNGASRFFEYASDDFSAPIRNIHLVGINAHDTEGLTYMGNGEVAVAFEGGYGVYIADVPDGDTNIDVLVKQTLTLAAPPMVGNNGLEGITYDVDNEVFYAVGEGQDNAAPRRFFRFERPADRAADLTWMDPGLVVTEPFDAESALPGSGGSLDLAGVVFDRRDGNVLIISHTGFRVFQVNPEGDGTILGELDLPPNQWEGVTLVGQDSDLLVVAEANEIQRYVYDGG